MKRYLLAAALLLAPSLTFAQAEICGDGADNNNNGMADEGCFNLSSGQCESPLSCGETGSVSPKKGVLRYSLPPDINPKVPWGPGIGMRRTYLSQFEPPLGSSAWTKPMGNHWQHTYMTWIFTSSGKLVVHTSQGQDVAANLNGSVSDGGAIWNVYTPQAGFHVQYVRQRQSAPNDFRIRLLTGETLVYNSAGRLTEIWDTLATPNKVLVSYDANGQVSTVVDASGTRRLLFGYDSSTSLLKEVDFQILLAGIWTQEHATTYDYDNGVSSDGTSKYYVPTSAAQWTNLLKGTNISNPSSLWLMQEASGNLADSLGSATGTLHGAASYQVAAGGWTRKGVKLADNSTNYFSNPVPSASTSSLAYLQIFSLNTTPGSGFRALNCLGSTQYEEAQLVPGTLRAQSGANTATSAGWSYGGTMVAVTKLDHVHSELAA